jgi:hypothetical protein
VFPKVCTMNPKGTMTSSQGMHRYVSFMATLKLTYIVIKGIIV